MDATDPGAYTSDPGNTAIPAGTLLDSFFIHMDVIDPPANTVHGALPPDPLTAGSITFDFPILGVIGAAALLDLSDSVVGDPGSYYTPPPSAREFWETNDVFTISSDKLTLTIDCIQVGSSLPYADQLRVLVVPEPGSVLLLGLGALGLVLYRKRKTAARE